MAAPEQLFNVRERKRFERHDIWERIAENGTTFDGWPHR